LSASFKWKLARFMWLSMLTTICPLTENGDGKPVSVHFHRGKSTDTVFSSLNAGRRGQEFGKPVAIGPDVWVGGGAILCPGVTVGAGAVIGAGSVVTRDIPAGVLAAGNPCRVLRPITE
jgi:acetyltransferase-like isoleucine patch superfamily enzyme